MKGESGRRARSRRRRGHAHVSLKRSRRRDRTRGHAHVSLEIITTTVTVSQDIVRLEYDEGGPGSVRLRSGRIHEWCANALRLIMTCFDYRPTVVVNGQSALHLALPIAFKHNIPLAMI